MLKLFILRASKCHKLDQNLDFPSESRPITKDSDHNEFPQAPRKLLFFFNQQFILLFEKSYFIPNIYK